MECTRLFGVQLLLILLNVAIQQLEGKKFIYKITISYSVPETLFSRELVTISLTREY
jgi:hypothetical protein